MGARQLTAQVVVDRMSHQTDKLFDYLVPPRLSTVIERGMRVWVPFGKGNKRLEAYVLNIEVKELEAIAYKELLEPIDETPILTLDQIRLIFWMRNKYLCKYIEAIRCLVPKLVSQNKAKQQAYVHLALSGEQLESARDAIKGSKQLLIFDYLKAQGKTQVALLLKELSTTRSVLNGLVKKGIAVISEEALRRDPFETTDPIYFPKLLPNSEQQQVLERVEAAIQENQPETFLLHGVTGSGKTEIYLQLIEAVIAKGQQGIVLVPEIALTPQTVARFRGRFGEGIALLHSHLSDGERYDEWHRIKEGKVNIVIGARSAIFAPLRQLGIIMIDEEHEYTYKSEQSPRYHALEVAAYRSQQEKAVLVLGSATPSLESYYYSQTGVYQLLTLNHRATVSALPKIEIVDMKDELEAGNEGILSRRLIEQMQEKLFKKEQIILFLNRRGYATIVNCKGCGHVFRCNHCDISMTYHLATNEIRCHYCGNRQPVPSKCPHCGGETLKYAGTGTQKLEQLIQALFPEASIARLDLDSTGKKGAHQQILSRFQRQEIDILIGTQMISKGLDFPNVTLVGIVSADGTLSLPDFRGPERTFQLITQVAGRAGRGLQAGTVILQTYQPDHYSVKAALNHDYLQFYQEELPLRKEFVYPPFSQMICIHLSGKNEKEVAAYAGKMAGMISYVIKGKGVQETEDILLGPNESVIVKLKEVYRYQIILKDHGIDFNLLKGIIRYFFVQHRQKYVPNSITVGIDMNPYNMM